MLRILENQVSSNKAELAKNVFLRRILVDQYSVKHLKFCWMVYLNEVIPKAV